MSSRRSISKATKVDAHTVNQRQSHFQAKRLATAVATALLGLSPLAQAAVGTVCNDNPAAPVAPAPAGCVNVISTYYANSPLLRKFVDTLPGLTAAGANTFDRAGKTGAGEYIPLAVADTTTYPGSNYYVIGVVEHEQWMHSDLQKPTRLRSYVQLYPQGYTGAKAATATALTYTNGAPIYWPGTTEQVWGYDKPHYLGPIIVTVTGTPVRTKMVNFLPPGQNMPLPVDESLGGAGTSPTQDKYSQSRVAFHLHGGDNPWISDGTPHQWITSAGDTSPYKRGVSQVNVPDMPTPGDSSLTLFWPNDQSSRLMWYHDHTFGLTRQNAYMGEAAGYLIIDAAELALLSGGTVNGVAINKALPGSLLEQIPLIIQDKGFVPDDIAVQDAKWDTTVWGKPGDLWWPHVYEPNQLWDATGSTFIANPAGRWDYAYDAATGKYVPPRLPLPDGSVNQPSATPESYMDTALVNGVAYPVLNVEPKAYRVRFLNGSNDRYINLSLWVADGSRVSSDGRTNTEIKMVPNLLGTNAAGLPVYRNGGVPDPAAAGPSIIQFGNESGLFPAPVVRPAAPIQMDTDEVITHGGLYLTAAERADTVIDFSQYAGKTLILYNDSAVPVPAGDPRYDYFTGNPDLTAAGGAPSTQAGFGPNIRTVMQIRIAPTVAGAAAAPTPQDAWDPTGVGGPLATELPKAYALTADPKPVTETFDALNPPQLDFAAKQLIYPSGKVLPLKVKTIEGFNEPNFGRLVAQIGAELPGQVSPTPLAYIDAPHDVIRGGETQYWLIKNNDADNHPMHFHLFNVQVLAHVTQTVPPVVMEPEEDEAGWKETVKNWPGQDVIVAVRPKTPQLPFGLPNSVRLLDPTLLPGASTNTVLFPAGTLNAPLAFTQYDLDPGSRTYGQPKTVTNTIVDMGWEYVWHCHILGHEENDLMQTLVFRPTIHKPDAPKNVTVSRSGLVSWTDPTPADVATTKGNTRNEIGFRVERARLVGDKTGDFKPLSAKSSYVIPSVNTLANATSFQDNTQADGEYLYRVVTVNQAGETPSKAVRATWRSKRAEAHGEDGRDGDTR
ncbi:MAG: multicopper oxidase domain-containing protein [Leptothrix sp. (in: b-proteobacteria)]